MNKVFFGDCRDSLRQLAAGGVKVDMCVTSPPYFGLRDYGHEGQIGIEDTPEKFVANLVEVFDCVRDVLADDGTLWLNLGDSYGKKKQLMGIPWRVAFALQADGWVLRQEIIWNKPNPMPESVKDRCTKAHEQIFLLAKSERYFFNSEAVREPNSPSTIARLKSGPVQSFAAGPKKAASRNDGNAEAYVTAEGRNKRSVWTVVNKGCKGAHFAVFPPALIKPCILAGSRPGGVVLDPFMGSGTTAAVALQQGRQYIGCELNPAYEDLQRERTRQPGLMLEVA